MEDDHPVCCLNVLEYVLFYFLFFCASPPLQRRDVLEHAEAREQGGEAGHPRRQTGESPIRRAGHWQSYRAQVNENKIKNRINIFR